MRRSRARHETLPAGPAAHPRQKHSLLPGELVMFLGYDVTSHKRRDLVQSVKMQQVRALHDHAVVCATPHKLSVSLNRRRVLPSLYTAEH